jgi:hypothetical protein
MQDEWIPFLEAIHRMCDRLFMTEYRAKPLLRSAVAAGRVSGRGEHKERGDVVFTHYGEKLDDDSKFIREGSLHYKAEVYPGEVILADLRSWMESLSDSSPLMRQLIAPPQQIASHLAGGDHDPKPGRSIALERAQSGPSRNTQPPQQRRVLAVLPAVFPDGVPGPDEMTNGALCKRVSVHMDGEAKAKKQPELKAPSRETILRAAGRQ